MTVEHYIKIDLQAPAVPPVVNTVQLDSNTRVIKAALYSGGVPFEIGNDASVSLACFKPDRTKCWYDQLPNGSSAASIDGNVVSVTLAPEVLTVAGSVNASIVIRNGLSKQISTFPFWIYVVGNPAAGISISNNYYKVSDLESLNNFLEDVVLCTEQNIPPEKQAQARANIGAMAEGTQGNIIISTSGEKVEEVVLETETRKNGSVVLQHYSGGFEQGAEIPTILGNIANGERDSDAATVGQLKSALPVKYIDGSNAAPPLVLMDIDPGSYVLNGTFAYSNNPENGQYPFANTLVQIDELDEGLKTVSFQVADEIICIFITNDSYEYKRYRLAEYENRIYKTENELIRYSERTRQLFDYDNATPFNAYLPGKQIAIRKNDDLWAVSIPVSVSEPTTVTVSKAYPTSRFIVGTSADENAGIGSIITECKFFSGDATLTTSIDIDPSIKSIVVNYWHKDTTKYTPNEVLKTLMVQYGDGFGAKYTGCEPYYNPHGKAMLEQHDMDIAKLKDFTTVKRVSNNLFVRGESTIKQDVYLGKDANDIEKYGCWLDIWGTPHSVSEGGWRDASSSAIQIIAGNTYRKSEGVIASIFDENDRFITGLDTDVYVFAVPEDGCFIRLHFVSTWINEIYLVEGEDEPFIIDDGAYAKTGLASEQHTRLTRTLQRQGLAWNHSEAYMRKIAAEANKYTSPERSTFLFVSDTHSNITNTFISGIAANMTKYVPCRFIAHGGDIINGVSEKENELTVLSDVCRNFNDANCPTFYVKGNHDDNCLFARGGVNEHTGLASDYITNEELYMRSNAFHKDEYVTNSAGDMYFYYDDEDSKIRSIFLNGFDNPETDTNGVRDEDARTNRMSDEQLAWLKSAAFNFSDKTIASEWAVILFSHAGTVLETGLQSILNTFVSGTGDFAEQGAMEVIALFHGDDHLDGLGTSQIGGKVMTRIVILNAHQTQDNASVVAPERIWLMPPPRKQLGTEDETAFDLVTIDRENHLIYLTRYGARSYVYNEETGAYDTLASRTRIVDYRTATYMQL